MQQFVAAVKQAHQSMYKTIEGKADYTSLVQKLMLRLFVGKPDSKLKIND
ncbi:hypothetical protein AB3Y13_17425 [Vibrio alginolyticus]